MHPIAKVLQQTSFLSSAERPHQAPADVGFEVAFAGRSNAGESSALNRLTHQRGLARTATAGARAQRITLSSWVDGRRWVDSPGYGFAKVSQTRRQKWQLNIDAYLSERESLRGIILLTDVRHPVKEFD